MCAALLLQTCLITAYNYVCAALRKGQSATYPEESLDICMFMPYIINNTSGENGNEGWNPVDCNFL
jgi:hypothetical protein